MMSKLKKEPMAKPSAAHAPASMISKAERAAIIDRTAGSLTAEEGDELARIIEEGCEQVDERD